MDIRQHHPPLLSAHLGEDQRGGQAPGSNPVANPPTYYAITDQDDPDMRPSFRQTFTINRKPIPQSTTNSSISNGLVTSATSPPSPMNQKKKNKTKRFTCLQTVFGTQLSWFWEIIGIFLSLASLIAVIFLLRYEDGREVTKWRFAFSLNTVISVLGALSRASLAFAVGSAIAQQKWHWYRRRNQTAHRLDTFNLFEEASKGPWGGLRLALRVRWRHYAVLGALVTVFLLAVEPFLQAIVVLDTRTVSEPSALAIDGGASSVSRRDSLDIGLKVDSDTRGTLREYADAPLDNRSIELKPHTITVDSGFIGSFFRGLDPSMLQPSSGDSLSSTGDTQNFIPSFSCPTSNCTFSPFTSLGVSARCNSVSHLVTSEVVKGENLGEVFISGKTVVVVNAEHLRYQLPFQIDDGTTTGSQEGSLNLTNLLSAIPKVNVNLDSAADASADPTAFTKESQLTIMTGRATTQPKETLTFQDEKTMLMTFQFLRANDAWFTDQSDWQDTAAPSAWECGLFLSANYYVSNVESGLFREELLLESPQRVDESWAPTDPSDDGRIAVWDNAHGSSLYRSTDVNRHDLQVQITPEDVDKYDIVEDSTTPLKFNVTQAAIESTLLWLRKTFVSDVTEMMVFPPNGGSDGAANAALFMDSVMKGAPSGGKTDGSGIITTFQNVAQSMTSYIRTTAPSSSQKEGVVLTSVVFYRVQWEFFILPGGVTFFGVLFFIMSVMHARRLGLPAWKGDQNVALIVGLDGVTRSRLRAGDWGDGCVSTEGAAWEKVRLVGSGSNYELMGA